MPTPAADIRKMQQMSSEELLAIRAQQEKQYNNPGIGGVWRNAWRGAKAAGAGVLGGGLAARILSHVPLLGRLFDNPVGHSLTQIGVAVYSFVRMMGNYKEEIREEASAKVAHIDIILKSRAQAANQQPTLQRLNENDLSAYRNGLQSQGQNIGQHTQNAVASSQGYVQGV